MGSSITPVTTVPHSRVATTMSVNLIVRLGSLDATTTFADLQPRLRPLTPTGATTAAGTDTFCHHNQTYQLCQSSTELRPKNAEYPVEL